MKKTTRTPRTFARICGLIVDLGLVIFIFWGLFHFFEAFLFESELSVMSGLLELYMAFNRHAFSYIFLFCGLWFIYNTVLISFFGKTLGQLLLKYKVIGTQYVDNPELGASILRFLFSYGLYPLFGSIPFYFALVDERRLHLGEIVSETRVLANKRRGRPGKYSLVALILVLISTALLFLNPLHPIRILANKEPRLYFSYTMTRLTVYSELNELDRKFERYEVDNETYNQGNEEKYKKIHKSLTILKDDLYYSLEQTALDLNTQSLKALEATIQKTQLALSTEVAPHIR